MNHLLTGFLFLLLFLLSYLIWYLLMFHQAAGVCWWHRGLHQYHVGWQTEPSTSDGSHVNYSNPFGECICCRGWSIRHEYQDWVVWRNQGWYARIPVDHWRGCHWQYFSVHNCDCMVQAQAPAWVSLTAVYWSQYCFLMLATAGWACGIYVHQLKPFGYRIGLS